MPGSFRFAVLSASLLAACTGFGTRTQESAVALTDTPSWETSIEPLMQVYCNECHSAVPTQGAPPGLRTDVYEDVDGAIGAFSARARILARSMDSSRPMPPAPAQTMTADEIILLERWIELGAPRTDAEALTSTGAIRCTAGDEAPCACIGEYWGVQTCAADGTYAACDCGTGGGGGGIDVPDVGVPDAGGTPDGGGNAGESLATLHAELLAPRCATVGCHAAGTYPPDMETTSGLRDRLLESSSQAPGVPFVAPGDPAGSYLYLKTRSDFTSLGIGFGGIMPSPADQLSEAEQNRIIAWIRGGAQP